MLHAKFQDHRTSCSGEEDFQRFLLTDAALTCLKCPRGRVAVFRDRDRFTIYGRGGHLGQVTSIMSSDFHFLVPESFHTKFGSDQHSSF